MTGYRNLLEPRQPHLWWAWAGVVLLASLAIYGSFYGYRISLKADVAEQRKVELDKQRRAMLMPPPTKQVNREEQEQWRKLRAERNFPWDRIFDTIETSITEDVTLLEFSPNKQYGRLVLRGEAKDFSALVKYMDNLLDTKLPRRVYLSHMKTVKHGDHTNLEFEVYALLR